MLTSLLRKSALTVVAVALSFASAANAEVKLQGAGASFPNPLYQRWVAEYQKAHPDVKIDYQSIGSGGGIKAITEKTVSFAGSDAPLGTKEITALGGEAAVVQVPATAGGVVPAYNVPGNPDLKFTGELLAEIFSGKVTNWNDAKIKELNPGVTFPDKAITIAYRSDGSGTTFVWTNYLATQSAAFKETIGMGKQVQWPVGQGGKGNEGVSAIVQQTEGAIGYVEANYATANKITFGAVKNKDGQFVKASPESVSAAGAGAAAKLTGSLLKADIWNQAGEKAYPVSSFTYLIVYKDLNNLKSKEEAQALVDYLHWAVTDGQKIAPELDYAPLAPEVVAKVEAALKELNYKGEAIAPSHKM
jgi:phosphate ABC transporter phosphate-binding protein